MEFDTTESVKLFLFKAFCNIFFKVKYLLKFVCKIKGLFKNSP